MNSVGYSIDPAPTSLVFCKFKFYLSALSTILPLSFVVLACLDRLMLSSMSTNVRAWSQARFAYRSIIAVSIFWTLLSSHNFYGATMVSGPGYLYCYIEKGTYTVFVALYSVIFHYLLPPLLMIILGLLTILNVRRTQRQVRPVAGHGYTHRKDLHLLRMLLFQVLVNIIFTIPAGVFQVSVIVI